MAVVYPYKTVEGVMAVLPPMDRFAARMSLRELHGRGVRFCEIETDSPDDVALSDGEIDALLAAHRNFIT